ncbi:MAG: penicillin-binding protein activator [Pseudomonadota bacterium]
MNTRPVECLKPTATAALHPALRPALRLALLLVLTMGLTMTLTACGGKKVITMEPQQPEQVAPQQPQFPVVPSLDEARTLWDAGDTDLAARYFYAIATAPAHAIVSQNTGQGYDQTYSQTKPNHVTNGQRAEAWQYYAMVCVNQGKAQDALNALGQSLKLNALVDQNAAWQETWFAAVSQMDKSTAMDLARAIYPDANRPWALRAQAGLLFAMLQMTGPQISHENLQSSTQLLSDIYNSASATWRASLEQQLYDALPSLDPTTLASLRSMVHTGNLGQFPYNIIQLQYISATIQGTASLKGPTDNKVGGLSAAIVQLQQQSYFENPQIMNVILSGDTAPATCLALALPMSGTYAPIGLKVARGASAAQWNMSNNGSNIDVHIINTESPSWIAQINALPSQCTTIGGPLRMTKYNELKASGVTNKRAFFTFMSQLNQSTSSSSGQASSSDEGRIAWRFFSSTNDQMAALLQFTSTLNIQEYGILAPDEAYGRRMTELFSSEASKVGGSVQTTTYPPKDPGQWNGIVSKFVKRHTVAKMPIPTATFQAVFLPDSWGNMEMLVPNLFYHGEDRQVLLGTSIWAQGLADGNNSTNNFSLAVFPSPWNPHADNPSTLALQDFLMQSGQDAADTWVGLGYDFVRFATVLGIPQDWTAASLNAQLASPSLNLLSLDWSMGAITWSADGLAQQDLFLFTPNTEGYELVNEQAFSKRLNATRSRHAKRVAAAKAAAK